MILRRALLSGVAAAGVAQALGQPVLLGGPAGFQELAPGAFQRLLPVPSLDINFLSATLDPSITWTRNSIATDGLYTDAPGSTYNTFTANQPRISLTRGLLIENSRSNALLNSDAPVNQTTASLGNNNYVLWIIGTGSATSSAGTAVGTGFGIATAGVPNVITITTPGTVVITVAGSLTRFQLEGGSTVPTSYIPTGGTTVNRAADVGTMPVGAWYNNAEGTQLVDFVKIVNAGGAFNDIPCLYQANTDMIGARIPGGTNIQVLVWVANAIVGQTAQVPTNLGTVNKIGTAYNRSGSLITAVVNGGSVNSSPVSALPTPVQFRFGVTRSSALDGWVHRLRYYSRFLLPAELQQATT